MSKKENNPSQQVMRLAYSFQQQGGFDKAIDLYLQVLKQDPNNVHALQLIGLCYHQIQRPDLSLNHLNRAVARKPGDAAILNLRGIVLRALGQVRQSLADFDSAVSLKPEFADAHYNRANALRALERMDEALVSYTRAAELDPRKPAFLNNLGAIHRELGNLQQALDVYDRLSAISPDFPDGFYNRGLVQHELGLFEEALRSHDRAIRLKPGHAEAHCSRANALSELKRLDEALVGYDTAIGLAPDMAEAHGNKAFALKDLNRLDEALTSYDKAVSIRPDYAEAYRHRGFVLRELRRLDEAVADFDTAIRLKPDYPEAYINRGLALKERGQFDEALASFDKAISMSPDSSEARHNKALLLLGAGGFEEGFELYKSRLNTREFTKPDLTATVPYWDGTPLEGQLLLWAEQGIGDEIFFASMLSLLPEGMAVVLSADKRLHPIYQRSFPHIRLVDRAQQREIIATDYAAQAPIGSLGEILKLDAGRISERRYPFLVADQPRKAGIQNSSSFTKSGPVCGLSWKSSNNRFGEDKSIALPELAPLISSPGISFVNLQYGDVAAEIGAAKAACGALIHQVEGLDVFNDINGLLALIDACDIILTTSNVTAHLAGSIGKKAAVLVPRGRGHIWYWQGKPNNLWYPSLMLVPRIAPGTGRRQFNRRLRG